MGFSFLKAALASAVVLGAMTATAAMAQDVTVGLITKTETNPFFVKMREGAEAKAKELGIKLITAAGKYDGDNDGQVAAIENLISAGAKGFAIVPSDSKAIVPTIQKARDAGLKVIVLDTPLDFESLRKPGCLGLGTAAVTVIDDRTSILDYLYNTSRFFAHESCGQCTPCREGTGWMYKMIKRIRSGGGRWTG